MRSIALVLALALVSAGTPLRADVKVSLKGGRMDILANKASVKEILDRVASVTGMKVIYDGPAPARIITKSVPDRTPAEAVLSILEGEGVNFAVILSADGTKVETLLVTGPSKARPAPPSQMPAGPEGSEWVVDGELPPPPPPPQPEEGAPPAPPADAAGATPTAPSTPTPFPTPSPQPSSPFTPQGPGPILMPPPFGTPMPR